MMAAKREPIQGQWSSPWVSALAATGAAVGLGNIWRFPYLAGARSGGSSFVSLACVAAVGLLIAVVTGWQRSRAATVEELHLGDGPAYRLWRLPARWIAPPGVLLPFLDLVGLL